MSRLDLVRPAVRPQLKGRVMLSGPPGSGKTRTALIVAEVLAEGGDTLMIDTERESALTYADDFTFDHLPWRAPFDPRELTGTIRDAGAQYDVVVVDSGSHFWRASGGTLDIANGKFTGWAEARPAQEDLIEAILACDAHVIFCTRAKMKHEQVVENGKHVVKKLGMGPIQDDDLEYEVNVSVAIDMGHTLAIAKSRTVALPVGREFKPGHAVEMAELYRDWLKGGEPPAPKADVDRLVTRMNALPEQDRKSAKQEFMATFGRPDHLAAAQLDDAEALVAGHEAAAKASAWAATIERPVAEPEPADLPTDEPDPVPDATPRDIAQVAEAVFSDWYDRAPRGHKGHVRDRLRHALIYAVTDGRVASLKGCTPAELVAVRDRLMAIAKHQTRVDAEPLDPNAGVEFTGDDWQATVLWAEMAERRGEPLFQATDAEMEAVPA